MIEAYVSGLNALRCNEVEPLSHGLRHKRAFIISGYKELFDFKALRGLKNIRRIILRHSDFNAITGSFLAANIAGIRPDISVNTIDSKINARTCHHVMLIKLVIARNLFSNAFIGSENIYDKTVPTMLAKKPRSNDSTLNIRIISSFLAPIERNIPIS